MTVGICILVDRRLKFQMAVVENPKVPSRGGSGGNHINHGRLVDAIVMGMAMVSATILFQLIIFVIGPRLGWVEANVQGHFDFVRASFLVISAMLGLTVGYYVPSTVATFLKEGLMTSRQFT